MDEGAGYASVFYESADGLRLHCRDYPGDGSPTAGLPVVCLPGLTRNARDFHAFALALRRLQPERRVTVFDYRGRGLSERAPDAATYALPVEAADVIAGLDRLGLDRAAFVGTSRGALILHLLAASHPGRLACAVLNDAGPKLEMDGLLAIKAYVGRTPVLPDWPAAIEAVRRINGHDFPALTDADIERMARAIFIEGPDGSVLADYDPRLAGALEDVTPETPLPELWPLFDRLAAIPLMVIRGERSRLFSAATLAAMQARQPRLVAVTVPGQGHAPLLETADLPERIADFVGRADPAGRSE